MRGYNDIISVAKQHVCSSLDTGSIKSAIGNAAMHCVKVFHSVCLSLCTNSCTIVTVCTHMEH